jgi:hypothetical protein
VSDITTPPETLRLTESLPAANTRLNARVGVVVVLRRVGVVGALLSLVTELPAPSGDLIGKPTGPNRTDQPLSRAGMYTSTVGVIITTNAVDIHQSRAHRDWRSSLYRCIQSEYAVRQKVEDSLGRSSLRQENKPPDRRWLLMPAQSP